MSKLVQLKHVTDGAWGWSHQPPEVMEVWGRSNQLLAIFCKFLEQNGYFNAIWITFRTFSERFERTKFLRFESWVNKSLALLQITSKTRLKFCLLGLNFVTWPGQGNQGTLLSATYSALNHSLEDFRFVMKITSFRNMYDQEPRHPRFNFNNLFKSISPS